MLKLDRNHVWLAPVTVAIAGLQATFNARLRLLPADEVDDMQAKISAGQMTGLQFADRVLDGWPRGEVQDENGEDMPNDPAAKAKLLAYPGVAGAVISAFWNGYKPATEGNSEPPPAG